MMHGMRPKKKLKLEELKQKICYPNLPHDVVTDILSRLPVKLLKRLSCQCRSWRDLIKNPSFVKMHLKHASTQNNHISFMVGCADEHLLSIDYNGVRFGKPLHLDFPYNNDESPVEVLGSCNGLFLLRNFDFETGIHNCLWNPSTREYKELPGAGGVSDSQKFGFVSYDCEQNDVSAGWCFDKVAYAFGYNNIIDDYNIVRVVAEGDLSSHSYAVDVYTLGSNSWRRVGDIPYVLSNIKTSPGILVNGAIHWEVSRANDTVHNPKKLLVALDLGDDKYKEVPLPHGFDDRFGFKVAALGGCLCIIYFGNPYERCGDTDIWIMKEYGERKSWSKYTIVKAPKKNNQRHGQVSSQTGCGRKGSIPLVSVSSDGPSTMFHNMLDDMKLVTTVKTGGIILKDGKQCSFLLWGKNYERVKKIKKEYDFVEPYVGSLVSLNSGTYCHRRKKEEGWSDDALNSDEDEDEDEEDDDGDEDEDEEDDDEDEHEDEEDGCSD